MEQRPFVTFWNGRPLGFLEKFSLSSFVAQGYLVHLYCFDPVDVPYGVELMDASEIMDRSDLFPNPREKSSFAGFSNLFRYAILEKKPVIWVDADVVCWNWSLSSKDYIFGWQDEGSVINGAVLAAPQKSALLRNLISKGASVDTARLRWGQLGPFLLTNEVQELELDHHVLPRASLYQLSGRQIWRVMAPSETSKLKEELEKSSAIHLWHSVLSNAAPELRNHLPPKGSLLDEVGSEFEFCMGKLKHLPPNWAEGELRPRLDRFNNLGPRIKRRLRNLRKSRN